MKVLIFGEALMPPAYIPRVRYFCTYLMERGWQIDYVLEASGHEQYIPDGVRAFPVQYYKRQGRMGKLEWLLKFVLGVLFDYKGYYFYRKSKPLWEKENYDAVFTSSFFTFPLTTACRVSRKLRLPLFVDLRDIAEQSPDDNHYLMHKPPKFLGKQLFALYKKISVYRRNRVLKKAFAVTTVSPWHVQTLSRYNANTHLIYNGFDEKIFYPEVKKESRFVVSYFGQVFNEKIRNPRLLFEAVQRLKEKKNPFVDELTMKWYVDNHSRDIINNMAVEYGLEDRVECLPFVLPAQVLEAMNKSSVLLVLSNLQTEKRYFGIMTTKFFEAIGANRPVLSIPDNQDNLSLLVNEAHAGLATSNVEEVERFLLEKYAEWKQNGYVSGTVPESRRLDYSRRKGAEILEKLFMEK